MNLTIFEGGVLAQATVTAVGSYPLFNLSVTFTSGSETDVQRNGEIVVEDSLGNFKGRLRVRIAGTISSTNIPINEVSKGTIDLQVNDVLKFTTEHRLRPILPVADETFSPDNLTYSDQNSLLAPLAVVNEPIAVNVDPGETYATISFDASNSVALDPDSAGTLSYLWTFPDATTSTSATVNKQISAGEDIVVCEVTDTSNSKTTTRYIPVYVHDNSDRPYGVANPSITGSIEEGWRAEFTTNYDLSTVPDGALCVFWNSTETVFIGWMSEDTHSRSSSQTVTIITVLGPIAKLKEMKGYSR